MEKETIKTINEKGLAKIKAFLRKRHTLFSGRGARILTRDMLLAWGENAEETGHIELSSWEALSKQPEVLWLDDEKDFRLQISNG